MKDTDIQKIICPDHIKNVMEFTKDKELYVFTDSGHGWLTPGKRSTDGSFRENEFNSAVEDRLTLLLNYMGIKTISLAPEWNDISLRERKKRETQAYNDYNITENNVCGVSIHANAYKDKDANGFRIYHYSTSQKGELLSDILTVEFSVANGIYKTGMQNGGVRKNKSFYMLRKTRTPFALIEYGFMTNPEDLELLNSDNYRNMVAVITAKSIVQYFQKIIENGS